MKVHDLTEVNVEAALEETFTTTTILTEKRNAENQPISVSFSVIICCRYIFDRNTQVPGNNKIELCGEKTI